MFKNTKVYSHNIPTSHKPKKRERIRFDEPMSKTKYKLVELRDFIFKHDKEIPKVEVDGALYECTKGQRRRFGRYGRIPIPVRDLLRKHNIPTGMPWEK